MKGSTNRLSTTAAECAPRRPVPKVKVAKLRACSKCARRLPLNGYTKNHWRKGNAKRKCKECQSGGAIKIGDCGPGGELVGVGSAGGGGGGGGGGGTLALDPHKDLERRVREAEENPPVEVRATDGKGYGMFAVRDLAPGDVILS